MLDSSIESCCKVITIVYHPFKFHKLSYGLNFGLSLDFCRSNPCMNGGTCRLTEEWYECSCLPGFTEMHCSEAGKFNFKSTLIYSLLTMTKAS